MKLNTAFRIEYYKTTGKLYTSATLVIPCEWITESDGPAIVYMLDAFDAVRQLKADGRLPGIGSGQWSGPIRVDHENGYPGLIL